MKYTRWLCVALLVACGCSEESGVRVETCDGVMCGGECCALSCMNGVCADFKTDVSNCGAPGHGCVADEICLDGACRNPNDMCGTSETWCSNVCADLTSDAAHCGACERACAANEACIRGNCEMQCAPQYSLCGEGCFDLMNDGAHCGSCDTACADNAWCSAGRCVCQNGYFDCDGDASNGCESRSECVSACDPPCETGTCVNGTCVDTSGEACDPPCETGTCVNGTCVDTSGEACEASKTSCYGECYDLKSDREHCGSCLYACAENEACVDGVCEIICNDLSKCDGVCVDTTSDAMHCGACHAACALGQACRDGACGCADGFYDCDGDASNGCESSSECTCTPGAVRDCYNGDSSTLIDAKDLSRGAKGICQVGRQTCHESGRFWSACEGAVYPSPLNCDVAGNLNGLDNDCDGEIDTVCRSECDLAAGSMSYIGCEYWGAYIDNLITDKNSNHTFVFSNPNEQTATIYIYDRAHGVAVSVEPYKTLTVKPHEVISVEINSNGYNMSSGSGILPNAFRVRSDIPITAYQFSPFGNPEAHSNDASLLLPKNVLGKDYYGMTWVSEPANDHRSYIAVIATEIGETKVTVKTTSDILATETDSIRYNASTMINTKRIDAQAKGSEHTYTLSQYDVLTLMAPAEISGTVLQNAHYNQTGTKIHADKNIAVFGASRSTYIPARTETDCCRDHIEEQLFPTQAWGKSYYAARAYSKGKAGDFWLITAKEDDTTVFLPDNLVDIQTINRKASNKPIGGKIKLNAGETFQAFETRMNFEIHADKPISVGQFLPSQGYNGLSIGDPSFILTVPYEQYRSDYDFMVPTRFDENYITVITPKDGKVQYDGKTLQSSDYIEFTKLGETNFYVGYYAVKPGVHHMVSDKPFGLYSYGYFNMSSYGYPIGLDLKILNTN